MDPDRQDSRGRRGGSSPPSVTVLTSAGVDGPRSSHPPGRGAPSAWERAGPGGLGPAAPCPACSAEPPGPRVAASLRYAPAGVTSRSLLPTHFSLHMCFPEGMHAWKMKGLDGSNYLSSPRGQVLRPDRELGDIWEGAELMHSFRDGESTCARKPPACR